MILRGDCVAEMRKLDEASIDAIVCDPPFGYWLAGLIDGEGCFRIHKSKGGAYYACHFALKLRDDDAPILGQIVALTGIGTFHRDRTRSGNSKPCAAWVIQSRADCRSLISILDRYPLRTRKARDYEVWRRAVEAWERRERGNRWHGPGDWSELIDLKRELEQARAYPEGGELVRELSSPQR